MHFDARAARLLQPGQHIMVDGCPGLRLEATETTRTWTYRFKWPVDGKMWQKKIGRWPAVSLAKAISECEALRNLRDSGVDPALADKEARAQQVVKAAEKRASKTCGAHRRRPCCGCRPLLEGSLEQGLLWSTDWLLPTGSTSPVDPKASRSRRDAIRARARASLSRRREWSATTSTKR